MNVKLKGFAKQMSIINRKQIPVCRDCHMKIHEGTYDGLYFLKIINNIKLPPSF
jgi:nicotine oxidoreductase